MTWKEKEKLNFRFMADHGRIHSANREKLYLISATRSCPANDGSTNIMVSSMPRDDTVIDEASDMASWQFQVEGTSGTTYDVFMDGMITNCSCPDCVFRHKVCKHIYFIVTRVGQYESLLGEMDSDTVQQGILTYELDTKLINRIFRDRASKPSSNNDEEGEKQQFEDACGICFEDDFGSVAVVICPACEKPFHQACMEMWWARRRATCPLCRGSFPAPRGLLSRRRGRGNNDDCLAKLQ